MKLLGFFLVFLGVSSSCLSAQSQREKTEAVVEIVNNAGVPTVLYTESKALIIAQSRFQPNEWPPLPHVHQDAIDLNGSLTSQGFKVEVAENLKAPEIIERLTKFITTVSGEKTRAVVYFAGHGWTDSNGEAYFMGADSKLPRKGSIEYEKAVQIRTLRDLYTKTKALHTLIILDSCYSGAILQTKSYSAPRQLVLDQMSKKAFQIIASGQKDERVSAESTFAQLFVAGISGAAARDKEKRFVTFSQLAVYLKDELPGRANQIPVAGDYPAPLGEMAFVTPRPDVGTIRTRIDLDIQKEASRAAAQELKNTFAAEHPGTAVFYYRKAGDGFTVIEALNNAKIPYEARPPQLSDQLVTNGLGCGPKTSISALKDVGRALINNGVKIAHILPYVNASSKGGRIEILSLTIDGVQNLKGMSLAELEAITSCKDIQTS